MFDSVEFRDDLAKAVGKFIEERGFGVGAIERDLRVEVFEGFRESGRESARDLSMELGADYQFRE